MANREKVIKEFEEVINRNCLENGSNTPDFILAEYLMNCLENFNIISNKRTQWYTPDKPSFPTETEIPLGGTTNANL